MVSSSSLIYTWPALYIQWAILCTVYFRCVQDFLGLRRWWCWRGRADFSGSRSTYLIFHKPETLCSASRGLIDINHVKHFLEHGPVSLFDLWSFESQQSLIIMSWPHFIRGSEFERLHSMRIFSGSDFFNFLNFQIRRRRSRLVRSLCVLPLNVNSPFTIKKERLSALITQIYER